MQIEAVIFDWGGTLTRWHEIDFHAESLALAHAVAWVITFPVNRWMIGRGRGHPVVPGHHGHH